MGNLCLVVLYDGIPFESLGLEAIRTYLQRNDINDVEIVIFKYIERDIDKFVYKLAGFDYVGISIMAENALKVYDLSERIKAISHCTKVFLGGAFATLAYRQILTDCRFIDFIVLGDGEKVIESILLGRERSFAKYIAYQNDFFNKKPYKMSICECKAIDHNMLNYNIFKRNKFAYIYTSKTCCANCSFCSSDFYINSGKPRWGGRRSIDDVFQEIKQLNLEKGYRIFSFTDASFEDPGNNGKKYINELCDLIISYSTKLSFNCYFRADSFDYNDSELIKKMKKAGFDTILIGIESMDKNDLLIYNKIATPRDNERSYLLFKNSGFNVKIGMIIFNPYTTINSLEKNFHFLTENRFYVSGYYKNRLEVYYGTPIYYRLKSDGLLREDYSYLKCHNLKYIDKNIQDIIEKVDSSYNAEVSNLEFEFVNFMDLYNAVLNIYGLEKSPDAYIFEDIKEELFITISEYYKTLYFCKNTERDSIISDKYNRKMIDIYRKVNIKKLKILKSKYFRDFFKESVIRNAKDMSH